MKLTKIISVTALSSMMALSVSVANAFECKVKNASMAKPNGFPDRALTMIVPTGQLVVQDKLLQQWLKQSQN